MKTEMIDTTTLAFMGDAVYEEYVRRYVIESGKRGASKLHGMAVRYVKAQAQAAAVKTMFDGLTEKEQALVKRARNHKSATKAKNADPVTYKWATALEALLGYLYLDGQSERMEQLIERAMAITRGEGD